MTIRNEMIFLSLYATILLCYVEIPIVCIGARSPTDDIDINVLPSKYVARVEGDSLNLTCIVRSQRMHHPKIKMSWHGPAHYFIDNRNQHVMQLNLTLSHLRQFNSGTYTCIADYKYKTDKSAGRLKKSLHLNVLAVKKKCLSNQHRCSSGHCIAKRYLCDGRHDCPDGSEEDVSLCGLNTCDHKIRCDDGRCLPFAYCCDPKLDESCIVSYILPCCRDYLLKRAMSHWKKPADDIPKAEEVTSDVKLEPTKKSSLPAYKIVYIMTSTLIILIFLLLILIFLRYYKKTSNYMSMLRSPCNLNLSHIQPASSGCSSRDFHRTNGISTEDDEPSGDQIRYVDMIVLDESDASIDFPPNEETILNVCPSYSEACLDDPPPYVNTEDGSSSEIFKKTEDHARI